MQNSSSSIELQTKLKVSDLYELYLISALRKLWCGRMALAIVLIVLFGILEGNVEFLRPLLEPPLIYVIVGVLLYSLLVKPYLASRALILSSYRSSRMTTHYTFSERGIDERRDHFEAHYDWEAIQRAKQSTHLVTLYITSYSAIIIPKRCFASDQQLRDFRTLITNQMKRRAAVSAIQDLQK